MKEGNWGRRRRDRRAGEKGVGKEPGQPKGLGESRGPLVNVGDGSE